MFGPMANKKCGSLLQHVHLLLITLVVDTETAELMVEGNTWLPCPFWTVPASDAAPRRLRLRSANLNRLTVPRCRLSKYGCPAFYHAGPTVWNSLPDELRNSDSFDGFKRSLNYFQPLILWPVHSRFS